MTIIHRSLSGAAPVRRRAVVRSGRRGRSGLSDVCQGERRAARRAAPRAFGTCSAIPPARITIDLGEKYEPALSKLGLGRVQEYDAKPDKTLFVVRDPAFTRFVKTIATSVVQSLLTASSVPGAWAQKPEAQVETRRCSSSRRRAAPLEVTAWLHVTYPAPQKSGRPKVQDLINGDLVFLGRPEAAGRKGPPGKP